MKFKRQFTKKGNDAYAGLEFKTTSSEIKNPDGTIVFSAPNIQVPANYSQVAADIIAQKYFGHRPDYYSGKRQLHCSKPIQIWMDGMPVDERST